MDEVCSNGQGVGLLCGAPSGWLADVDLDVPEALSMARCFLRPTRTSGHGEALTSHWWYFAEGIETKMFYDTDGRKRLVELRAGGCQTLVAPSVYPGRDEEYAWNTALEIETVAAGELRRDTNKLATAVLIASHLPEHRKLGGGGRHDYALALAGYLLRDDRLDRETVLGILLGAWDAKWWPSEQARREAHRDLKRAVEDTVRKLKQDKKVTGGQRLEEMEPGLPARIADYWGWSDCDREEGESDEKEERPTQAQLLVRCATGAELFHTPAGEAFASVPVGDHRETHQAKTKCFRRYLVREFFNRYDRLPGAQALQDALGLLEARAQFDGTEREVYVRVAGGADGRSIYVDLANEQWEVGDHGRRLACAPG